MPANQDFTTSSCSLDAQGVRELSPVERVARCYRDWEPGAWSLEGQTH